MAKERQCSISAYFASLTERKEAMLTQATVDRFASLADRRHVTEPFEGVLRFARRKLARGVWQGLIDADRERLIKALRARHKDNLALYVEVTRGAV